MFEIDLGNGERLVVAPVTVIRRGGGSSQAVVSPKLEAAAAVEGFLRGAGREATGQDGLLVVVVAGAVDRAAPAGGGSSIAESAERQGGAVGELAGDVGKLAVVTDGDARTPACGCPVRRPPSNRRQPPGHLDLRPGQQRVPDPPPGPGPLLGRQPGPGREHPGAQNSLVFRHVTHRNAHNRTGQTGQEGWVGVGRRYVVRKARRPRARCQHRDGGRLAAMLHLAEPVARNTPGSSLVFRAWPILPPPRM